MEEEERKEERAGKEFRRFNHRCRSLPQLQFHGLLCSTLSFRVCLPAPFQSANLMRHFLLTINARYEPVSYSITVCVADVLECTSERMCNTQTSVRPHPLCGVTCGKACQEDDATIELTVQVAQLVPEAAPGLEAHVLGQSGRGGAAPGALPLVPRHLALLPPRCPPRCTSRSLPTKQTPSPSKPPLEERCCPLLHCVCILCSFRTMREHSHVLHVHLSRSLKKQASHLELIVLLQGGVRVMGYCETGRVGRAGR